MLLRRGLRALFSLHGNTLPDTPTSVIPSSQVDGLRLISSPLSASIFF